MNSAHLDTNLLIFTDLDGCLLDHRDYSDKPAQPLLNRLSTLDIPVVPATSKTESELIHLRRRWANGHPFIVENGAAVYIPEGYFPDQPKDCRKQGEFWVKSFTRPRQHWLSLIERTGCTEDQYQTFADSNVDGIADLTGLDRDSAARASERLYGEPVAWRGTERERERFVAELEQMDANVVKGGRFLHVSGDCDKGKAMTWLINQYVQTSGHPLTSIAIGDSQNDTGMLESADIAIVIPSPTPNPPQLKQQKNIVTAFHQGPTGWAESLSSVLKTLNVI